MLSWCKKEIQGKHFDFCTLKNFLIRISNYLLKTVAAAKQICLNSLFFFVKGDEDGRRKNLSWEEKGESNWSFKWRYVCSNSQPRCIGFRNACIFRFNNNSKLFLLFKLCIFVVSHWTLQQNNIALFVH